MPKFKSKSISSKLVQEKFEAGELLARAHYSEIRTKKSKDGLDINLKSFLDEMGGIAQSSKDDRQLGNRSASATLLVPGLDLGLFHDIAFLHDVDQCTVRAYMYRDSATTTKVRGGQFFNIKEDKANFVPIISRIEFIQKYKEHFQKMGNDSTDYNEVLANIFPESLLGMALSTKNRLNVEESMFRLLAAKIKIKSEYQVDLPIFLYQNGKLIEFTPSTQEILNIVNTVFNQNGRKLKGLDAKALKEVYVDLLSQVGYELSNPDLNLTNIQKSHLWKKEIDTDAFEEFYTLSETAINALLTEQNHLMDKKKYTISKIIEDTIEEIRLLKKEPITSNAALRTSLSKLKEIIEEVAIKKELFPTNVFKKIWNYLNVKISEISENTKPTLEEVFMAQRERAKTLREMAEKSIFFYKDFETIESAIKEKYLTKDALQTLRTLQTELSKVTEWKAPEIHSVIAQTADKLGIKMGSLAQPLRVAVTGNTISPSIDLTLQLIGKERVIARLDQIFSEQPEKPDMFLDR